MPEHTVRYRNTGDSSIDQDSYSNDLVPATLQGYVYKDTKYAMLTSPKIYCETVVIHSSKEIF